MNKTFKRFLSIFLAVLMVITVIPMGVYAAETEETEVVQVSELEESRDLYSKTYETSEDTNVVISAAVPLHYEENGELKDIDNTLVKSEEDSSVLTNKANAYNVELPKKYTDDSEITVDYENNSISFKLLNDVKSSKGNIEKAESTDIDETNAESVAYAESNMDKLSSAITYENIIPDTDFEYNVQPDALKENIILNRVPDAEYTVQYELNTGNLEAVLNEGNSITLFDGEKEIFFIESPYMIDADDTISENVSVSLEKSENNYILTYTPDYSWLASDNTTYPVIIDPTITVTGTFYQTDENGDKEIDNNGNPITVQHIEDTYVGGNLSTPQSNAKTLSIQNNKFSAYYNIHKLPELPKNATVNRLNLNLTTTATVFTPTDLKLFSIENNQDNFYISDIVGSTIYQPVSEDKIRDISISPKKSSTFSFNLTAISNQLFSNDNNKFALIADSGSSTIKIASSEYDLIEKRPYISIEYSLIEGINNKYQFTTQDSALAGTAYINDYTGNLIVERKEFESQNSNGITIYMGDGVNNQKDNAFGENISINYYQTLKKSNFDNNIYELTYGDGSKEYIDTSKGYEISSGKNESDENYLSLGYFEDDDYKNKIFTKFDEEYVLTEYKTTINKELAKKTNETTNETSYPNQQVTTLTYDSGYLVSIENSIDAFDFSYDYYEDNNSQEQLFLSEITRRNNISANVIESNIAKENIINSYKYDYETNTLSITFDSEDKAKNKIEYGFDSNKNIIEITDEFGEKYKYTYNDNNQVTKVQEFAADGTAGEYLTFEYGNNTTTISDGKDTYTEYFDLAGNLESVVDQNGNAVFAQYKDNLISKISETRNSARNIANFYGFESNKDSFFKTNNGTVAVSNDAKFNGNSSVKLTTPAQTKAVFDGKINNLEKNSTYTVSMWIKKDDSTNCSLTLTNSDSSGIFTTVNSQQADGWQQFYCTLDTGNSNNLNIALTVDNSEATANTVIYTDNMHIQKSPYLTNINLLENNDFSNGKNSWNASNPANVFIETEDANISTADNNRLKLKGDYLSENSAGQTVPITANAKGTKYTYGGWIKAVDSLPAKEGTDREIGMSVYGISDDGTSTLLDKTTYSSYLSNWQYIESELTLPEDNITQLKFVVNYNYQTGYALFDGLSLSQDELYTIEFEYDENNEIKSIITNGTTVSLSEDENNETESSYNCSYAYDDYGNVIKQTETATVNDITKSLVSKFKYGNNGSLLTGEMSALGRWTNYEYDYFGNVASVVDANGNEVQYEYDNFQNVSAIINNFESNYIHLNDRENGTGNAETYTLKVQYTYTGNRLDKIETGNIEDDKFVPFNTYAFEYDKWGNQSDIYINDMENPYIHYEYDETNYHQLNSVSYINNQEIHYVYDDNGNIIYEYDGNNSDGDTLSYSYYYYDDGTCYGKKNLITGTIESYQDGLTTVKDSDGNILHVYGYDENGNMLEQIGNQFINITETEGAVSTTIGNNTNVVTTEYDEFGRIIKEKLKSGTPSSYIQREYTYYDNNEDNDDKTVSMNQILGTKNEEAMDADVDTTNLIRFLTYYIVSVDDEGNESSELLRQYRYLYSYEGNTLSYTIASTDEYNLNGLETVNFFAYNSGNMLTANGMYLYNYDSHGNIANVELNRTEEAENHLDFTYDENSGTQLNNTLTNIKIVSNGDATNFGISYDTFGNIDKVSSNDIQMPLNDNGVYMNFSNIDLNWSRGSTLSNITGNAEINYKLPIVNKDVSVPVSLDMFNYQYDDNNLRTGKSINLSLDSLSNIPPEIIDLINPSDVDLNIANADIDYIWRDGKLVGEEIDCSGSIFKEGDEQYGSGAGKYSIVILYDKSGNAYGFNINKTEDADGNAVSENHTFYYLKDADNTIDAIIDEEGNTLVKYTYDSYGMVLGLDNAPGYRYLMLLNPLAYRDYNYDIESGMYYLQSRYYAPYVGRFISPDSVLDTGSGTAMCTHLYSYCENNPTNYIDPSGNAYISNKSLRTTLKALLLGIGLNPLAGVAVVCLHIGLKALRNYIIAKATVVAGRFGALINPAVAAFSAALALVISGFSATTVARALIEGKGISITWARTKKGKIYGISVDLR